MIALTYRTAIQRQSLTMMAQTERAANEGPAKFPFKIYNFWKKILFFVIYYVKVSCFSQNNYLEIVLRKW